MLNDDNDLTRDDNQQNTDETLLNSTKSPENMDTDLFVDHLLALREEFNSNDGVVDNEHLNSIKSPENLDTDVFVDQLLNLKEKLNCVEDVGDDDSMVTAEQTLNETNQQNKTQQPDDECDLYADQLLELRAKYGENEDESEVNDASMVTAEQTVNEFLDETNIQQVNDTPNTSANQFETTVSPSSALKKSFNENKDKSLNELSFESKMNLIKPCKVVIDRLNVDLNELKTSDGKEKSMEKEVNEEENYFSKEEREMRNLLKTNLFNSNKEKTTEKIVKKRPNKKQNEDEKSSDESDLISDDLDEENEENVAQDVDDFINTEYDDQPMDNSNSNVINDDNDADVDALLAQRDQNEMEESEQDVEDDEEEEEGDKNEENKPKIKKKKNLNEDQKNKTPSKPLDPLLNFKLNLEKSPTTSKNCLDEVDEDEIDNEEDDLICARKTKKKINKIYSSSSENEFQTENSNESEQSSAAALNTSKTKQSRQHDCSIIQLDDDDEEITPKKISPIQIRKLRSSVKKEKTSPNSDDITVIEDSDPENDFKDLMKKIHSKTAIKSNDSVQKSTRKRKLENISEKVKQEDDSSKDSTESLPELKSTSKRKSKFKKIKNDSDEDDEKKLKNNKNDNDDDILSCDSDDELFLKNKKSNKKNDSVTLSATTKRRNLRKLLDDSKLTSETKRALEEEQERKERLQQRNTLITMSQSMMKINDEVDDSNDANMEIGQNNDRTLEVLNNSNEKWDEMRLSVQDKIFERLFLDINLKTGKKLIEVDPLIARKLKPHQVEGIKFMWDSCYESVDIVAKKQAYAGGGCILAHCMGLGKTLQIVAFVHTLLANKTLTNTERVLIFTPVNALRNWCNEFEYWLKDCKFKITIYDLNNTKTLKDRLKIMRKWNDRGGIFIIGYQMFTNLTMGKGGKMNKEKKTEIEKYFLNPGADLVVCDEGHVLKNEKTNISKYINQIKTRRRIVLTGTPLQNNLIEYHCMVSFVKPNLLGTLKEFKNRFANPIYNGQHADSTDSDVKYMKKRAHVLHNALDGCVQRKDYSIIKVLLPRKYEYVISVRLTDMQRQLYQMYLTREGLGEVNKLGKVQGAQVFADFNFLYRIWTHPYLLKMHSINAIQKLNKINDFIEDQEEMEDEYEDDDKLVEDDSNSDILSKLDDDCDDDDDCIIDLGAKEDKKKKATNKRQTRANAKKQLSSDSNENSNSSLPAAAVTAYDEKSKWWKDLVTEDCKNNSQLSAKILLFEEIIKNCERIGDKILVFSHSLYSLDIIEEFLKEWTLNKKNKLAWLRGVDYYRIDGSTDVSNRQKYIDDFNDPESNRMRLFLISTKAGGIGINLTGANRVIIFDASWNPCHDVQSIFRVYRFGQTKPVFIYRLLAQGTMEEKIYQRQVTKQSLSQRVLDEHQLDRHFTSHELRELYSYEPDVYNEEENAKKPTPILPYDMLLAHLLKTCDKIIVKYHEHDSLLENKIDEGLTEDERQAAWREYRAEKEAAENHRLAYENLQKTAAAQAAQNLNHMMADSNEEFLKSLYPHLNNVGGVGGGVDFNPFNINPTDAMFNQQQNLLFNQLNNNLQSPNMFAQGNQQNPALARLLQMQQQHNLMNQSPNRNAVNQSPRHANAGANNRLKNLLTNNTQT